MATDRTELERVLDAALARAEAAVVAEFEQALVEQGLDQLRNHAEPLVQLGRRGFSQALVLIAAGAPDEARGLAFDTMDFNQRMELRRKALAASHAEGELINDVFDTLSEVGLAALRAALPFVLAAL